MKKMVVFLAVLFLISTMGMASATPIKNVTIEEVCRNDRIITYGIYLGKEQIDVVHAKGYLDLLSEIKEYEETNQVKLNWNYRNKGGVGNYETQCNTSIKPFPNLCGN